ncbi:MAG: cytochrome c oxidase assembly protein [Gammaproteobacteria bacterium]|nr:cytochrome c oxidase assembly protein [Gammaproteobacteria bacterium]
MQDTNRKLSLKLALGAVAMFGFGYALVPLYDVYCKVTGLNGKTDRIGLEQALTKKIDRERWVNVEFVANTAGTLPWDFRPDVTRVRVHPGEITQALFAARNTSNAAIVGQAVPSVTPSEASLYFHKTECFCFTRQPLAPGEAKEMPVRFVIDPELPARIGTVTLSYMFFSVPDGGTPRTVAAAR